MKGNIRINGGSSNNNSYKVQRKIVEKNRRIHMKNLCFKLSSLIPKEDLLSKHALAQHDHLDHATSYIMKLRERIERLKQRKNNAMGGGSKNRLDEKMGIGFEFPVIEIRHQDPILEVVLITDVEKKCMFYEVIGILEEEGAEVVNASFSAMDDKTVYTIHSQAVSSRIGIEVSRVSERLKELIQC